MENGQSVFSLSPHPPYGRVRLARFARIRLLSHALPISLLILRKKPTVLQSTNIAVLKIAFVLLHQFEMSGSEHEFHLPNVGIAYETYNNDTSETRALISEEIDRKRPVVLISCK